MLALVLAIIHYPEYCLYKEHQRVDFSDEPKMSSSIMASL